MHSRPSVRQRAKSAYARAACRRPHRPREAGFTLTELLVVVVIIGLVAALGVPRLTRERVSADGRAFAEVVTKELQRARMDAVATRLPQYAFVYSDRVEIRSAKPGATPTAPLLAPGTADPLVRQIRAKDGMTVRDVMTAAGTPAATLTPTSAKQVVFSTMGAGFLGPNPPAVPGSVFVYLDNTTVPENHPDRRFRIDIAPLTGSVALRTSW